MISLPDVMPLIAFASLCRPLSLLVVMFFLSQPHVLLVMALILVFVMAEWNDVSAFRYKIFFWSKLLRP